MEDFQKFASEPRKHPIGLLLTVKKVMDHVAGEDWRYAELRSEEFQKAYETLENYLLAADGRPVAGAPNQSRVGRNYRSERIGYPTGKTKAAKGTVKRPVEELELTFARAVAVEDGKRPGSP